MAGDSLLSRKSLGVRLAPSSNPDVLKCQDAWPPNKSTGTEEAAASTSSHDNSTNCSEEQQWDLVALKVLLADDRPGCNSGTDLYEPLSHYINLLQTICFSVRIGNFSGHVI